MTQTAEVPTLTAQELDDMTQYERKAHALRFYATELDAGRDPSALELAALYGKTDRWGRGIRSAVHAERDMEDQADDGTPEWQPEHAPENPVPEPSPTDADSAGGVLADIPAETTPVPALATPETTDNPPEIDVYAENLAPIAHNAAQEGLAGNPRPTGRLDQMDTTEPHAPAPSWTIPDQIVIPAAETLAPPIVSDAVPFAVPAPVVERPVKVLETAPETPKATGTVQAPFAPRAENPVESPMAELVDQNEIRKAANLQYAFYGVAVVFALVGQVWVGVIKIPWPDSIHPFWRVLILLPALAVIELAGVATSHQADLRRRMGEQAYGYRTLSLLAAVVAAGINLAGHWGDWLPAVGFTGLSAFAYCSWLMQSNARRRDALRAAGKLASTPPVYGITQWAKEPRLTRRARTLAVERGYDLHTSLRVARDEARTERRRKALAAAIERRIVEQHNGDEIGAAIAATTYDLDRLAVGVEARLDYASAEDFIAADLVLTRKPARDAGMTTDLSAHTGR